MGKYLCTYVSIYDQNRTDNNKAKIIKNELLVFYK